jgi:hypothetical protein
MKSKCTKGFIALNERNTRKNNYEAGKHYNGPEAEFLMLLLTTG